MDWRADLHPTTARPRTPTPPGTPDRLLYLLGRLATTAPAQHADEQNDREGQDARSPWGRRGWTLGDGRSD
ncbi:hypothetical protein ACWGKU_17085 [Kitasatospora sp. NPDC054768]